MRYALPNNVVDNYNVLLYHSNVNLRTNINIRLLNSDKNDDIHDCKDNYKILAAILS